MKLYYFTESYPYGLGENWKTLELRSLLGYFDSIVVVPLHYNGNRVPVEPIPGVTYLRPLLAEELPAIGGYRETTASFVKLMGAAGILFRELRQHSFGLLKRGRLRSLFASIKLLNQLLPNPEFNRILRSSDEETIWYFFWGRGVSEVFPFIKHRVKFRKAVCRMHGYDLYLHRNGGYIPFQYEQVRSFDHILPCSSNGWAELVNRYPHFRHKIQVQRLGVEYTGTNPAGSHRELRLVSCSALIPLKRVHLVFEALQLLDIPVSWTHIGGGPLFDSLQQLTAGARDSLWVDLKGQLPASAVLQFYQDCPVDLFLNVSETEGAPVSIMEALSFGIPVVATDVGGTAELLNEDCGFLLPHDFSPRQLADILARYYQLSTDDKQRFRTKATARFRVVCDHSAIVADLKKVFSNGAVSKEPIASAAAY